MNNRVTDPDRNSKLASITALGKRLSERDPKILAEIYKRYGAMLLRTIDRLVHDVPASEDVLQETLLKVWKQAECYDGNRGPLKCWLITIARHTAIDYLRSKWTRSNPVVVKDSDRVYDIELESLKSDMRHCLGAAIGKLNSNQRRAIELAFFEDMSHAEMAEETLRPLGTVKTHVRAGLKALRRETELASFWRACISYRFV